VSNSENIRIPKILAISKASALVKKFTAVVTFTQVFHATEYFLDVLLIIRLVIAVCCSTWPVDDPSKVQKGRDSALLPAASTFFLSRVLVLERVLPAASILRCYRNI
jgi:hypothetical protein